MPHAISIRLATPAELPAILDIYNEQVHNGIATFDTQPRTEAAHRAWFDKHPPEDYPVFVAVASASLPMSPFSAPEVIFGWASLSPWSERKAYDRTAEVSEYIHKDHRGRGVGTLLLQALIESARARGRKVLLARVSDENVGSVRYHEKLGFSTVGVMHGVGEKFGRVLDVRIMEMQL